jgi:hypothetical protein
VPRQFADKPSITCPLTLKRAGELATLKDRDMLLSTLRRYVEAMGGRLELVAQFPNRPPVVIDHLAPTTAVRKA